MKQDLRCPLHTEQRLQARQPLLLGPQVLRVLDPPLVSLELLPRLGHRLPRPIRHLCPVVQQDGTDLQHQREGQALLLQRHLQGRAAGVEEFCGPDVHLRPGADQSPHGLDPPVGGGQVEGSDDAVLLSRADVRPQLDQQRHIAVIEGGVVENGGGAVVVPEVHVGPLLLGP